MKFDPLTQFIFTQLRDIPSLSSHWGLQNLPLWLPMSSAVRECCKASSSMKLSHNLPGQLGEFIFLSAHPLNSLVIDSSASKNMILGSVGQTPHSQLFCDLSKLSMELCPFIVQPLPFCPALLHPQSSSEECSVTDFSSPPDVLDFGGIGSGLSACYQLCRAPCSPSSLAFGAF